MPAIDRTSQFFQIADRIRSQSPAKPHTQPSPPRAKSTFTTQSAEVKRYLNATTNKLERLARLATKKSVFDDHTQEIEDLSFDVKSDIKELQTRVRELQATVDSKSKNQIAQYSTGIVDAMNTQLMATTNGFKEVLMSRAENMQSQSDRRGQFGSASALGHVLRDSPAKNMFSPFDATSGSSKPLLDVHQEEEESDELVLHMNVSAMEQMQMVPTNSYAQSREVAVQNIQKTMVELSEIFQQMVVMLKTQEESLDCIDRSMDETVDNVQEAEAMWTKYLESIRSNRMLVFKIFAILLAFGLFFIVFLK